MELNASFGDPRLLHMDDFFLAISFSVLTVELNPVIPNSQFARQLRAHGLGPAWVWSLFTFGGFGGWEQGRHEFDK